MTASRNWEGRCRYHWRAVPRVGLFGVANSSQIREVQIASRYGPFVVLLHQQVPDQAENGGLAGNNFDGSGAAFDFLVQAFDQIGAVDSGVQAFES